MTTTVTSDIVFIVIPGKGMTIPIILTRKLKLYLL